MQNLLKLLDSTLEGGLQGALILSKVEDADLKIIY